MSNPAAVSSPADLGWGDPRLLTSANTVPCRLWPGHMVQVRNDDCAVVFPELARRLRRAGWRGPDALLDEWGYNRRLKRWAEDKYRTQGLTEAQWLRIAPLPEWSDHAWATAVDLDTTANPMLPARPANPAAHTTLPIAACPGIAAGLGLQWGGSWSEPWDPQHFQVAVTPPRLKQIADEIRGDRMRGVDYSAGRPGGAVLHAAGFGFAIRYIGTPGRRKNLTLAEADDLLAHGVSIGLVYEDNIGTALQGFNRGVADARASLADAAACGVQVRCVYLALDFDAQPADYPALDQYFMGAATILGLARTGAYGGRRVLAHLLDRNLIRWAWQTIGWSQGLVEPRADVYQNGETATVGGIACDINNALTPDIGQWPYEEDDMPAAEVWAEKIKVPTSLDPEFAAGSYAATEVLYGANVWGARNSKAIAEATRQVAALSGAVTGLTAVVAAQHAMSAEELTAIVRQAVEDAVVDVDVTVHGNTTPGV